jgi:hypothetical protein
MGEQQEYKRLTREELEKLAGEPLPERAAMLALIKLIASRSGNSAPSCACSSSWLSSS